MNNVEIYTAFVLDEGSWGSQLLRYDFEYPTIEYWAEPESQELLKAYFKKRTGIEQAPIVVEPSKTLLFYKHQEV